MRREQKEGPPLTIKLVSCHTKDNVEVTVDCYCKTLIVNTKQYQAFMNPRVASTGKRIHELHEQVDRAITYVLKYYNHSIISGHKSHIEHQIKNCLNENYPEETESLFSKGLAIKEIEIFIPLQRKKDRG